MKEARAVGGRRGERVEGGGGSVSGLVRREDYPPGLWLDLGLGLGWGFRVRVGMR